MSEGRCPCGPEVFVAQKMGLNLAEGFDGCFDRVVVVADEETVLVDIIGVFQCAVDRVIEVFENFVFSEVARYNGAAFEAFGDQSLYKVRAFEVAFGFDHEGEAEPAAGACFALDAQV